MSDMMHFHALEKAALTYCQRVPVGPAFSSDLQHDKNFCEVNPPSTPFVWAITPHSTHIVPASKDRFPRGLEKNRCYHIPTYIVDSYPEAEFFVWDGTRLQMTGLFGAIDFLHAFFDAE